MLTTWRFAATGALLFQILGGLPALGSVTTPQKSLRALAGRQVWVPICSRRGANGSAAWFDNTSTAVMDQVSCVAPSFGVVTALKIVYSGFDMPQQGEVDRSITATGTASFYMPSANLVTVTANGGNAVGSTTLTFSATSFGANGISLGQIVTSTGGGIAAGTYVSAISNSFLPGSGNTPSLTSVTLSTGVTAATAPGQPFSFAGEFAAIKFGGRRQFTIEPGHDVVTSDATAVQLAPSQQFFVRGAASFSSPGLQLMDYPGAGSRLQGEFDSRGATINDQTMNPVVLSNTGGGFWCPVAVLALVTIAQGQAPLGALLVLGDSIAAGTGDVADALGLQGFIQRSLENALPFITLARGSTTAFGLVAHGDGQYALSVDTGITDVLLEDGRNDILAFQNSDAALRASIQIIATRYVAAGKRVWCFTIPPTTQSNDGWVSLINQSWTVATASVGASPISVGSIVVGLTSTANLSVGQTVSGPGIGVGAAIVSLAGLAVTLSVPTVAVIPAATKLSFGSLLAASSPSESYRLAFNGFMRTQSATLGCTGLIDVDRVLGDQGGSGKWRVDLGAASIDGVHPSVILHQAVVDAGLIAPRMFLAQ